MERFEINAMALVPYTFIVYADNEEEAREMLMSNQFDDCYVLEDGVEVWKILN